MLSEDPQKEPLLENTNINPTLEQDLDRIHRLAEGQLEGFNEYVKVVGSASNNALIMLAVQFALASLCTMLVNIVPPIRWIVEIVPTLNVLNFLIFVILCGITQYGSGFFKNTPFNFLWFMIHFSIKVGFLVFYGVQYPENRLDVFYFFLVFAVVYVYVLIKDKESGHDCDLTVKGNFFKLVSIEIVLAIYLCLLGQTGLGPAIYIPIGGIIYTFFLLLELQRFNEILYLRSKSNSIFLGAAQIDADMVFFCSLAWGHLSQKKNQEIANKQETDQEQQIQVQQ